ncbi:hypothetical protein TNIN_247341 [Trichonephila inaurata madagascariensis]|uniref:Uncharacterized protein n=1 Tax=Trichonephila inaurata madagascariensis TaxID=2747483 RepID=A0A8X6YHZ5_9ARAC|nr:hypothetical protein TNIN_247341 [Trichonephila inaurata madagascariensis]
MTHLSATAHYLYIEKKSNSEHDNVILHLGNPIKNAKAVMGNPRLAFYMVNISEYHLLSVYAYGVSAEKEDYHRKGFIKVDFLSMKEEDPKSSVEI